MDEWRCSGKDVRENRWMRRQVFEANVCWALDEDRFLFVAQRGALWKGKSKSEGRGVPF